MFLGLLFVMHLHFISGVPYCKYHCVDLPVPFNVFPSALLHVSLGMGMPTAPQRSNTLLPTMLLMRDTAEWTLGSWHCLRSAFFNRTPERFSGMVHLRLVSMKVTDSDGDFENWTRPYNRQSQSQGLSWSPVAGRQRMLFMKKNMNGDWSYT